MRAKSTTDGINPKSGENYFFSLQCDKFIRPNRSELPITRRELAVIARLEKTGFRRNPQIG